MLFIWFTVILLIKSTYNASLSSICTLRGLDSPIKGIESLMGSKHSIVGYQQGSFSADYLRKELNFSNSQLVPLKNEDEYAKALQKGPKNGGVAAIVDDKSRIKHFLSKRCDFTIRGRKFNRFGKGFVSIFSTLRVSECAPSVWYLNLIFLIVLLRRFRKAQNWP